MADRIIAIVIVLSLVVIGYLVNRGRYRRLAGKATFAQEFMMHLKQYIESGGRDMEAYARLIYRSPKMQKEMGSLGFAAKFRHPFANYIINKYPIILNMIPEIRKSFDNYGTSSVGDQYAAGVQEALLRYLGFLSDAMEGVARASKNPIMMLREGVQFVLMLPICVWHWAGLISRAGFPTRHRLVKIASSLVTLLTVVSAVITVVLGWSDVVALLRRLFWKR